MCLELEKNKSDTLEVCQQGAGHNFDDTLLWLGVNNGRSWTNRWRVLEAEKVSDWVEGADSQRQSKLV